MRELLAILARFCRRSRQGREPSRADATCAVATHARQSWETHTVGAYCRITRPNPSSTKARPAMVRSRAVIPIKKAGRR